MFRAWFKQFRAVCGVGVLSVLLAACATPQRIGGHTAQAAFERTGRFALSVNYSDGKRDAVQGGFAWNDDGRQLILDLANPLGSTLARVRVQPGRAMLTRSDGSTEQAPGPDALVDKVLGSPMPVGGLRDWLQGRTGSLPTTGLIKAADGSIARFEQDGWRVVLSRYDQLGPRLLQLNRTEAGRTISVRLAVDGQ